MHNARQSHESFLEYIEKGKILELINHLVRERKERSPSKDGEKSTTLLMNKNSFLTRPSSSNDYNSCISFNKSNTTLNKKSTVGSSTTQSTNSSESEFGAYNFTAISEYKLGKSLGQGAYAVVKEGHHKHTGSSLAIKVYDKYKLSDIQRKRSAIREIKILKKMQHENIVTLYDAIDT